MRSHTLMRVLVLTLLIAPGLAMGANDNGSMSGNITAPGFAPSDSPAYLAMEDHQEPIIQPYGNLLRGGGFEDGNYSSFTGVYPTHWSPVVFLDRFHWYATSPEPVFDSASGGLRARSTHYGSEVTARWYQSFQVPIQNVSLSLQWWLESNSDPQISHNTYRVHLQFSNNRHIYYYLSGYMSNHINGSSTTAYRINGDTHTWHLLERNVTADYLATGMMPYSPSNTLNRIDIEIYCRVPTSSYTQGYVDNVVIQNGTYVQIGESVRNGNFEASTDWLTLQNSIPGTSNLASYSAEGSTSLNLTLVTDGTPGGVGVRQALNTRLTASSTHWLRWQYFADYTDYTGSNMMTSVRVACDNATHSFTINYVIESRLGMMPSNTSNELWFDLGVIFLGWITESHDLWADAAAYFATDEIWVNELALRVESEAYAGNQRYEMLWDDIQFVAAYHEDPGFETQGPVGHEIRSSLGYSSSGYFTVTNTSYRGEKAANVTIPSAGGPYGSYSEYFYLMDFPREGEAFIDFMWQLDDYTPAMDTFVRVELRVDDDYYIHYYLGAYGPDFCANTSHEVYLNATGVNTIGSWQRFHYNIRGEFQTVFDYTPEQIESVTITVVSDGIHDVTLLLDDVYVYTDVTPPTIIAIETAATRATDIPHTVTIDVEEWPGTPAGTLYYRYQTPDRVTHTPWTAIPLNTIPGDPTQLTAAIPAYDSLDALLTPLWPLEGAFYLQIDDSLGNTMIDDNASVYYTYTLLDTTAPTISVTNPQPNATVMGTIAIIVTAADPHSGVAYVEAYLDGELFTNSTAASFHIEWITSIWVDGDYTWTFRCVDYDGNIAETTLNVTVLNASSLIVFILIAAAVGICAVAIVGIYWYLRIRPKAP